MRKAKQFLNKQIGYIRRKIQSQPIQMMIAISFTVVSLLFMGVLGVALYHRFVNKMQDMTMQSAEQLLSQTAINLEDYLRNMRRISDAMYYSVIKDKDLSVETLDAEMKFLFYKQIRKPYQYCLLYERRNACGGSSGRYAKGAYERHRAGVV